METNPNPPAAAAAADFPFAPRGFPSWLPPMLVKELRQGLRTPGFVGAFLTFQILMAVLMMVSILALPSARPSDRAAAVTSLDSFFWTLLAVLLLVVTPARALVGLRGEIDSRTLDLLVLSRLTAWRIVLGKWASLVAQATLMLIAMLPYGIVRYFGGSVNLGSDARDCILIMGGCAVLTAVALWASVLPRLAVAVVIVLLAANQVTGGVGLLGYKLPALPVGSMLTLAAANPWTVIPGGLIVLAFSLVAAVRRIAPPVENYAPLARGLALLAFIPVPLLAGHGSSDAARAQLEFAAGFLAVVCAVELSGARSPLAAHGRAFRRFGFAGRGLAVLALPGWPSALAFAAAMACATIGLAGVLGPKSGTAAALETAHLEWLVVLALGAIVFPSVVLSFFPNTAARSGRFYILVIGIMCLITALSSVLDATVPFLREHPLSGLMAALPVSGFWFSLFHQDIAPGTLAMQALAIAVLLAAGIWQSRGYWAKVATLAAPSEGDAS